MLAADQAAADPVPYRRDVLGAERCGHLCSLRWAGGPATAGPPAAYLLPLTCCRLLAAAYLLPLTNCVAYAGLQFGPPAAAGHLVSEPASMGSVTPVT